MDGINPFLNRLQCSGLLTSKQPHMGPNGCVYHRDIREIGGNTLMEAVVISNVLLGLDPN